MFTSAHPTGQRVVSPPGVAMLSGAPAQPPFALQELLLSRHKLRCITARRGSDVYAHGLSDVHGSTFIAVVFVQQFPH